MSGVSYEQVNYDGLYDIRPIIATFVHTYPHWHGDIEILLVCQGVVTLDLHGNSHTLRQGDVAVVNSEEIHSVNSGRDDPMSGVLILQISPRFLRGLHIDVETVAFRQPDDGAEPAQELRRLLLALIDEIKERRPAYEVIVYSYCATVIALLCRFYALESERGRRPASEKDMQRLKRVFTFVQENYRQNPSIADAAASEFISPYHLSHFFSRAAGMTYSQYLNGVKIDMVLRDLIETGDSVTEIMQRHGFANPKTFHHAFKRQVGCSPTDYRRSVPKPGNDLFPTPRIDPALGSYIGFMSGVKLPDALYREGVEPPRPAMPEILRPPQEARIIPIDSAGNAGTLDRYFSFMTTAARASDLLRAEFREHLRLARRELGFRYVRFHGLFGDEMGILPPSGGGRYNFTYVDAIFDFLREIGVKPFLELGFMPTALASGKETIFFYRGNITPPSDYALWGQLVHALASHLVSRYSLAEVSSWYFEVWNEPNLAGFWAGTYAEYLELYRASAEAIKSVSPALRVGGPAISSFQFGKAKSFLTSFLRDCGERGLPVDFISGHPYPVLYYQEENGVKEVLCDQEQTARDMRWLRDAALRSAYPEAEIHLTEWNSSSVGDELTHDTAFMAGFILHNCLNCGGLAHSLAYWAVSDLFEESGVPGREFHGGFGLLTKSGFKKPQYFAFQYLNRLGDTVLARDRCYIATKADGSIQILAWNYCHYNEAYAAGDKSGMDFYDRYGVFDKAAALFLRFQVAVESGDYIVEEALFDREHGSAFDLWLQNGCVEYLSQSQRDILREENHPARRVSVRHCDGTLCLQTNLPAFGFVFYEIKKL